MYIIKNQNKWVNKLKKNIIWVKQNLFERERIKYFLIYKLIIWVILMLGCLLYYILSFC
jgi:hypothetical protein